MFYSSVINISLFVSISFALLYIIQSIMQLSEQKHISLSVHLRGVVPSLIFLWQYSQYIIYLTNEHPQERSLRAFYDR